MNPLDTREPALELISFQIGGQEYCIDIRSVLEIRGWTPTTPIPQAPDYMLGVINLRGVITPVLDLRCRLGLGRTEPSSRHVIVVIQQDVRTAGVVVDEVQETFQVPVSLLQAPPAIACGAGEQFVDAIFPLGERMLSRLVVAALLPAERAEAA